MRTMQLVLVMLTAMLLSTAADAARTGGKPNVIFILADDLGYGDLGAYGQQKIKTPNIDRIAAEGMKFTQFYSAQAVCAPARCGLMTGKHMGHADIRNNRGGVGPGGEGQEPLDADEVTIAELMKKHGYATGAFGKWGLGMVGTSGDPNKQGIDTFYGYNCQAEAHNFYPDHLWHNEKRVDLEGNDRSLTGKHYSHDLICEQALKFIRDHKDEPFFLYVPSTIPHLALQVPEDDLAQYKGKWEDPAYDGKNGYLPHPHPRAAYAAMISLLDKEVGRIMSLVKELGLDDNTIIMFSSDNGPLWGRFGGTDSAFFGSAGGLRASKGSLYEAGIRVPLVARWPGKIKPGTVTDHVAAFWDLMPTFMELIGERVPGELKIDGISFAPTLLGAPGRGEQKQHEFLYWEFTAYSGQQAVRMDDWKAIRVNMIPTYRGNRGGNPPRDPNLPKDQLPPLELYNLKSDPGEQNNVAAKHPELIAKAQEIMKREHVPSKKFPFPQID